MGRFSEALDRAAEDIKRPAPPPIGHYTARVTKYPDTPKEQNTSNGNVEILRIQCELVAPQDDVEADDIAAWGGTVARTPFTRDFFFPTEPDRKNDFEQALANLKRFCEHCGIEVEGKTMGAWLRELPNAQFTAEVGHQPDKEDPEIIYMRIRKTAPLE